jgi:uncharacterized metal-binding protein
MSKEPKRSAYEPSASQGPECAKCPGAYCSCAPIEELRSESLPDLCPMRTQRSLIESISARYEEKEVRDIYVPATITEKEAYEEIRGSRMAVRPRLKELIEFARLTGMKKIGMAFCSGLRDEARRVHEILEEQNLTVVSVMCKCGGIDKTLLGVEKVYKIDDPDRFEAGCNPVLQAELLNRAGTDFNVIVGLCLGHDMLFTSCSAAPVTTLIVKDRVLGHNPSAALYSAYHRRVLKSQKRA